MPNYSLVLYPTGTKYLEIDTVLTSPTHRILLNLIGGAGPTVPFQIITTSSNQYVSKEFMLKGTVGKTVYIDWGDSSSVQTYNLTAGYALPGHTYATAGTHNVSITGDTNYITGFQIMNVGYNIDMADLPPAASEIMLYSPGTITGASTDLTNYSTIASVQISSSLFQVSGSVNDFAGATYLVIGDPSHNSSISCDVSYSALNSGLTYLSLRGLDWAYGDLENYDSFSSMTGLEIVDCSAAIGFDGTINNLPPNLFYLNIQGGSFFGGSIANLPTGLVYLYLIDAGNFTGDIQYLTDSIYYLYLQGSIGTSMTGSLSNLPTSARTVAIEPNSYNSGISGTTNGGFPSFLSIMYLKNIQFSGDIAKPAFRHERHKDRSYCWNL